MMSAKKQQQQVVKGSSTLKTPQKTLMAPANAPRRANITGNPSMRNASSNPNLNKKEKKKLLNAELNIAKTMDTKGRTRLVHTVPECMQHYISARLDPWNTGAGACLPSSQFTQRSAKYKVTVSGQLQLGTSGVGYIALLPAWGNNSGNVVTTISTSIGTINTAFSAFTNLQTYSFVNLPYPGANFGPNLQGRFVAGGIRIQYTGTLLNQNGLAYSFCDQDHSSVTNTGTLATIGNLEETRRVVVTGNVHTSGTDSWLIQVTDNGPVVPNEYEFVQATSVQATPYMILAVQGLAGDAYEFEAVQHIEIMGSNVANMTASHTDEDDYAVVDKVLKDGYKQGPPQAKEEKGLLSKISDGIVEYLPKITQMIGGGLSSLPAIVQGLMNIVPMTGGNPLLANQGFSYPMLMAAEEKIKSGNGYTSNLLVSPQKQWNDAFVQACVDNCIEPSTVVEMMRIAPDEIILLARVARCIKAAGLQPEEMYLPGRQ